MSMLEGLGLRNVCFLEVPSVSSATNRTPLGGAESPSFPTTETSAPPTTPAALSGDTLRPGQRQNQSRLSLLKSKFGLRLLKDSMSPACTPSSVKGQQTPGLRTPILRVLTPQITGINAPRFSLTPASRSRKNSLEDLRDVQSPLPTPPPREQLTLIKQLGKGGFGSVWLGRWAGRRVAVKTLHASTQNQKARGESYKVELAALGLRHPNVVRTLAASGREFDDNAYIVMEYAGDYDLHHVIEDVNETLDMERRLRYSLQMARALTYIHGNCIAHLDLKPANVLLSPGDVCKIGDFGCCQLVEPETGCVNPLMSSCLTGTSAYRAPEILRGESHGLRADIYAYAVTLWQLQTRQVPFPGENQHVVIFGVVAYGRRPRLPDHVTDGHDAMETLYSDLYQKCWTAEPARRPRAEEICDAIELLGTMKYR